MKLVFVFYTPSTRLYLGAFFWQTPKRTKKVPMARAHASPVEATHIYIYICCPFASPRSRTTLQSNDLHTNTDTEKPHTHTHAHTSTLILTPALQKHQLYSHKHTARAKTNFNVDPGWRAAGPNAGSWSS